MPSPFPGMDPYLEIPHVWPDFHNSLAYAIRALLNRDMPKPFYAQLEVRPEVGIVEIDEHVERMVPDVTVLEPRTVPKHSSGAAVLESPRTDISKSYEVAAVVEPIRHAYVEIRDTAQDHRLVTLIEIVSPSNKRAGKDRDAYLEKQQQVLASDASLVEIDLHRGGQRLLAGEGLQRSVQRHSPPADYLVDVSRAWNRDKWSFYPINIREVLPVIGVPLREQIPEVPLDLQFAATRAYDEGPYARGAVDYSRSPSPPLRESDRDWARQLVVQSGLAE
ncbi:MAG TPA: DUF4058 family protein [Pirellulaceae bacterium]|nr:DUF4058 family protein [Pirellulaceae bacterium]